MSEALVLPKRRTITFSRSMAEAVAEATAHARAIEAENRKLREMLGFHVERPATVRT